MSSPAKSIEKCSLGRKWVAQAAQNTDVDEQNTDINTNPTSGQTNDT